MYRLLIIVFILWFLTPGGQMAAAEGTGLNLDISVEVPLQGIYKNGKMVRFYVNVKNQDQPFAGEMIIKQLDFGRPQTLSSPHHFQLAANEEQVLTIDVNSDQLMNVGQQVGISIIQDGEEVDWVPIEGLAPHHEWLVGVLSKNTNAFHFLSMAQPENGRNLSVKQIKPGAIPNESILLNHLDILAISGITEGLEEKQIIAIKEWIASGGVLLVSGGKSYETASTYFGDILPYPSSETSMQDISSELERLTNLKAPVQQVSVLKEAKSLFHTEKYGHGLILTMAYDATEEPIASWQGNKTLWHQAVNQGLLDAIAKKDMKPFIDHGLMDISYMTPGVTPPQFPLIATIWGIYILVITPGLYLFLKRRDKREWAWFLIPSLSILLTAGVYMLGKYGVAKEDSVHTVSSIQILDEQHAEVNSAVSFLMVEGGTYTVEKEEGTTIIPLYIGSPQMEEKVFNVESGALQFKRTPYLSMKEVYSKSIQKDVGYFENHLSIEDDRIQGKVRNLTSFDLKNVLLNVGMQEIALGNLPKGQEIQIDKELQRIYVPESSLVDWQKDPRTLSRWERMERLQRNSYDLNGSYVPVTLSGLSEEGLEIFQVGDREEEKYYSTLIRQGVTLFPTSSGKQIFPYGTLPLRLGETKGNWEGTPGGYYFSNGFFNFALSVQPNDIEVHRIVVPLNEAPYKPFTKNIYNVKKEQWETLDPDQPLILSEDEKDAYITPKGEIVLRFIHDSEERVFLTQPYFLVEGEVNKHD